MKSFPLTLKVLDGDNPQKFLPLKITCYTVSGVEKVDDMKGGWTDPGLSLVW